MVLVRGADRGGRAMAQTVPIRRAPQRPARPARATCTVFGKRDPNVRKATAIVNGDGHHRHRRRSAPRADRRVATTARSRPTRCERLRAQVLRNLIDETLQIQEAAGQRDHDQPKPRSTQTSRASPQQLQADARRSSRAYLRSVGSSRRVAQAPDPGRDGLAARCCSRKIEPFVNVSDDEVKAVIARLKAAQGHRTNITSARSSCRRRRTTQPQVAGQAQRIVEQIRSGASFPAYARQFSEASTAAVGGDLGWVRAEQLPERARRSGRSRCRSARSAGRSRCPAAISIIALVDKRQVLTADPRDAVLSLKQLTIAFPPASTAGAGAAARRSSFAEATQTMGGCGRPPTSPRRLGRRGRRQRPGQGARPAAAAAADAARRCSVGQATPPFGSLGDGVRVLVLCGRDDPPTATRARRSTRSSRRCRGGARQPARPALPARPAPRRGDRLSLSGRLHARSPSRSATPPGSARRSSPRPGTTRARTGSRPSSRSATCARSQAVWDGPIDAHRRSRTRRCDVFDDALPLIQRRGRAARSCPGQPDLDGARCALDSLELAVGLARSGAASRAGHRPGLQGAALRDRLHPSRPDRVRRRALRRRRASMVGDDAGRADAADRAGHHPYAARATCPSCSTIELIVAAGAPRRAGCSASSASTSRASPSPGSTPMPARAARSAARRSRSIAPAIERLREEGIDVDRPASPPTRCSTRARARDYDAALCMYHDQALIPLKTLHFDEGVNMTLGLPIVRTSPDHGTAFDIAGQERRRSRRDDRGDPRLAGECAAPRSPRRDRPMRAAAAARGDRAPRPQRVEGARPEFPARRAVARPDRARARAARTAQRVYEVGPGPGRPDPRAARRRRAGDRGRARPALPARAGRAGRSRRRAGCT